MKFNLSKTPEAIKASSQSSRLIALIDASHQDGAEVMIMDVIGESMGGASEVELAGFLNDHRGDPVTARINSFGGDAFAGIVMHNLFQEHGNVTAVIEGVAFSAASVAAAGANVILMKEQSTFGIHRAWTGAAGNSNTFKGVIEWLDAVDQHQIDIFANRTDADPETVEAWLDGTDDGTVFNSADAVKFGFADEVIPLKEPAKAASTNGNASHARYAAEIHQKRIKARLSR